MSLNGLALSLQINKRTYIYSYRYKQQFHILSITATACLIPLTVFKTVTMLCQTKQQNFSFLGLVAGILNRGHTHYNRSYTNPIQVYTACNLYTVTPQPEGPKNTLTNCICTPCFNITACLNIVIHFCFMPATRLKQWWVANKLDTLLCHIVQLIFHLSESKYHSLNAS